MRWRRRAHQAVMALYGCAVLGCVAMVAGPALHDAQIHANPGRGVATVTDQTRLRTYVEYETEDGRLVSPRDGVLYPTGLGPGQQVWVTYAKNNTELVKVEGRGWALSLIPALSVLAVATIIAALSVLAVATIIAALAWLAVGKIHVRFSRNSTEVSRQLGE